MRDVSEERAELDVLHRKSRHDTLTHLLNRAGLEELFTQLLLIASRRKSLLTILYIDLDGFKAVNDCYGHHVGDKLLQKVASLFRANVRKADLVARLGGDEFCIVLVDVRDLESTLVVVDKLLELFSSPIVIEDESCSVTLSIGVAQFPKDGDDCSALLKHADMAMYIAKKNGKNQYKLYEP